MLIFTQKFQNMVFKYVTVCSGYPLHFIGYSGADVASLCSEAAMGPIRNISIDEIKRISSDKVYLITIPIATLCCLPLKVRPVKYEDFMEALKVVRPSVSFKDLKVYEEWNKLYGCGR